MTGRGGGASAGGTSQWDRGAGSFDAAARDVKAESKSFGAPDRPVATSVVVPKSSQAGRRGNRQGGHTGSASGVAGSASVGSSGAPAKAVSTDAALTVDVEGPNEEHMYRARLRRMVPASSRDGRASLRVVFSPWRDRHPAAEADGTTLRLAFDEGGVMALHKAALELVDSQAEFGADDARGQTPRTHWWEVEADEHSGPNSTRFRGVCLFEDQLGGPMAPVKLVDVCAPWRTWSHAAEDDAQCMASAFAEGGIAQARKAQTDLHVAAFQRPPPRDSSQTADGDNGGARQAQQPAEHVEGNAFADDSEFGVSTKIVEDVRGPKRFRSMCSFPRDGTSPMAISSPWVSSREEAEYDEQLLIEAFNEGGAHAASKARATMFHNLSEKVGDQASSPKTQAIATAMSKRPQPPQVHSRPTAKVAKTGSAPPWAKRSGEDVEDFDAEGRRMLLAKAKTAAAERQAKLGGYPPRPPRPPEAPAGKRDRESEPGPNVPPRVVPPRRTPAKSSPSASEKPPAGPPAKRPITESDRPTATSSTGAATKRPTAGKSFPSSKPPTSAVKGPAPPPRPPPPLMRSAAKSFAHSTSDERFTTLGEAWSLL